MCGLLCWNLNHLHPAITILRSDLDGRTQDLSFLGGLEPAFCRTLYDLTDFYYAGSVAM